MKKTSDQREREGEAPRALPVEGATQAPTKIQQFPNAPGVYRMLDAKGHVLYIGKAKELRKRVASYWSRQAKDRYQIEFLMRKVTDVDCIVTDTEKEALILESTLIKKHRPRYNLDLRDDKSFPSIKLSIKDKCPRIYYTREIQQDGSLYFGPYTSAFACKQVVDFVERYFKLRTCSDREFASRTRPCIQYQIGRCSAPCVDSIEPEAYEAIVQQVRWLLEGKSRELKTVITTKMQEASDEQRYEDAGRYRDLLADLDTTLEQQKMVNHRGEERDCIGLYREGESGMLAVLMVREGKVCGSRWFPFKKLVSDADIIESFLIQYYREESYIPKEICQPLKLEDAALIGELLSERSGHKVKMIQVQRGEKRDLVDLAIRNAREAFQRRSAKEADVEETLQALQEKLHLGKLPQRIECFDISNIQGKQPVGSVVRFNDGEPAKNLYRRFKIKTLPEEPNDYAMMYELLKRRLVRAQNTPERWEMPDLLVIDGGKGQLNIAQRVLQELDVLNVDLCSLAKPHGNEDRDKVFRPGRKNPIRLDKNSSVLHLLMRLRDEAHRFAITYHKSLRSKTIRRSKLDTILGVGPSRKKTLLKYFGSLKRVEAANTTQLQEVEGISPALAEKIYAGLH